MKISVEMSLYPLESDYASVVWDFIAEIKQNTQIELLTNGMSTQVFGEIEEVMPSITKATQKLYESKKAILVLKIGNGTLKL